MACEVFQQSYMMIAMVKAAAKVLNIVRTTVEVARDCVVLNSSICTNCGFASLLIEAMLAVVGDCESWATLDGNKWDIVGRVVQQKRN